MASTPAEAVRKLYVNLVVIAEQNCNELCDHLYAKDLISREVRKFVHDKSHSESDKVRKLIDTVIDVIERKPTLFSQFLTILKLLNGPVVSDTVLKLEEYFKFVPHKKELTVKLESSSSSQDSNKDDDKLTSSESSYHSACSNLSDSIKSPDIIKSEIQGTKEQHAQTETKHESVQRLSSNASSGYGGSVRDSTISDHSRYSQYSQISTEGICPPNAADQFKFFDHTTSENAFEPLKRKRLFGTKIKPAEEIEKSRLKAKTEAYNKTPPGK